MYRPIRFAKYWTFFQLKLGTNMKNFMYLKNSQEQMSVAISSAKTQLIMIMNALNDDWYALTFFETFGDFT